MSKGLAPVVNENGQLTQVESFIYYLDSRQLSRFSVSGVYLLVGDGITLIETGTTLTAPHILKAVQEIGFKDKDIKRAIVTHIHLDHAGGTGWLVRRLPHMQVYVHENGSAHLHDPSKLIESAKTVYGTLENITAIHGEILPVPHENLVPVTETELDIGGGVGLRLFDAPGHAPHHLCIYESASGCLFSGEALGHYRPEAQVLSPAVAPPGFDFKAAKATIQKIQALNPRTICFSQYGQHRDPEYVINKSLRQLIQYYELIMNRLKKGLSTEEVIDELSKAHADERGNDEVSMRGMLVSIVLGYQTYFQRMGELK